MTLKTGASPSLRNILTFHSIRFDAEHTLRYPKYSNDGIAVTQDSPPPPEEKRGIKLIKLSKYNIHLQKVILWIL
jgi:hypothetical protein